MEFKAYLTGSTFQYVGVKKVISTHPESVPFTEAVEIVQTVVAVFSIQNFAQSVPSKRQHSIAIMIPRKIDY